MTGANRQATRKTYLTAPFYLASLPCLLLSLRPRFGGGIVMWWRAILSLLEERNLCYCAFFAQLPAIGVRLYAAKARNIRYWPATAR